MSQASLAILRQLLLERVAAGQAVQINSLFADISADIERLLSGKPLTEYQGRRLAAQIKGVMDVVNIKTPDLTELAVLEANWAAGSLASVAIESALPAAATLNAIASASLVQGATIGAWMRKIEADTRFAIDRAIRAGVAQGLTNQQITRNIVGTVSDGSKGSEPLKRARRDAQTITRTAVQTISNEARLATYEANDDVIAGVQQISTLDSRTSDTCIAYSGKIWRLPSYTPYKHRLPWNGGTPRHWNCRSTIVPLTQLDEDRTGQTRASAFGPVPADLTFDDWLKSQPKELVDDVLGVGRAELWRDKKITLSQLVDGRGKPLTLSELRTKYAD